MERTFSIIKPNAVADNNVGNIVGRFEKEGLRIAALKLTQLSKIKLSPFLKMERRKLFLNLAPKIFGSKKNFG